MKTMTYGEEEIQVSWCYIKSSSETIRDGILVLDDFTFPVFWGLLQCISSSLAHIPFTYSFCTPLSTVVSIYILPSEFIYSLLLVSIFGLAVSRCQTSRGTPPHLLPVVAIILEGLSLLLLFQSHTVFMHKEDCIGICGIMGPLLVHEPRSRF